MYTPTPVEVLNEVERTVERINIFRSERDSLLKVIDRSINNV